MPRVASTAVSQIVILFLGAGAGGAGGAQGRRGVRPKSAQVPSAHTPTHDSAVGQAALAAVRPSSPASPDRAISPRQFYEQVRPWTSAAQRPSPRGLEGPEALQAQGERPMLIQVRA
jgi:hypothetical protein